MSCWLSRIWSLRFNDMALDCRGVGVSQKILFLIASAATLTASGAGRNPDWHQSCPN
jgi:hypothetical protein